MSVEEIEKRRADRKAALSELEKEQYAKDLEALDVLEQEHGDSNVDSLRVPFTPGLPVLVAVKTPSKLLVKIYKDRLREAKPNPTKAAEEIGGKCLVYPDQETYEQMLEARPGIATQTGLSALKLSTARATAEGED